MSRGSNRIKIEGTKLGRLTVIEPVRTAGRPIRYRCTCDCGTSIIVLGQSLRLGTTQSCGCLHRERSSSANLVHGKSKSSIHNIWLGILQRCENPDNEAFKDYGGRGISVCEEWHDFNVFYRDMGDPPPKMTIERKDNSLGYSKDNCHWATRRIQANNRRSNKHITFRGKTMTQAEWERELGLRPGRIYDRLYKGWSLERALTVY